MDDLGKSLLHLNDLLGFCLPPCLGYHEEILDVAVLVGKQKGIQVLQELGLLRDQSQELFDRVLVAWEFGVGHFFVLCGRVDL